MSEENKAPESGSSFSIAFKFLTDAKRKALSSYYAFAHAVDDIVDDTQKSTEQKKEELMAWRKKIDGIFIGQIPENDTLCQNLAETCVFYNLKKEHFTLLIEGMELDLTKHEYATIEDLEYYMYRVAGVVGEVCLRIFEYRNGNDADSENEENSKAIARMHGYAVQLTNIIRDVREDYESGRVYIPYQDLARFSCDKENFSNPGYSKDFTDLMTFEAERAKKYYMDTLALVNKKLAGQFFPSLIIWQVYYDLLLKIEKSGFHVKEGKVKTTKGEKISSLIKAMLKSLKMRIS